MAAGSSQGKRQRPTHAVIIAHPEFQKGPGIQGKGSGPGRLSKQVRRGQWSPLPGTRREAEALESLFKRHEVACTLLLGPKATKASLFELKAPRYLHIGTHGFFLKDQLSHLAQESERGLAGLAASKVQPGPNRILKSMAKLENPLIRSGLVLSGANQESDWSEGFVTALELTGMDCSGTELVVLSACETGLGKIVSGEGSLGLRWSFLYSGAQRVISSLWRVPDQETAVLMEKLYEGLLSGTPPDTALRNAMLYMRKQGAKDGALEHPYYWAGFSMVARP